MSGCLGGPAMTPPVLGKIIANRSNPVSVAAKARLRDQFVEGVMLNELLHTFRKGDWVQGYIPYLSAWIAFTVSLEGSKRMVTRNICLLGGQSVVP